MSSPRTKKTRKKTAFVPRTIFLTALGSASVIPLCACGGQVGPPHLTVQPEGVALIAFDGGDGGKKHGDASVSGVAADAFRSDAVAFLGFDGGVAVIAFDGGQGDTGQGDAGSGDAQLGVAADAFSNDGPILGVACIGFDGGPCG